ncbi:MAG TPA: C25 family cysteine peptidase [bacterium]|nr:C25 family cysteine peptidase [bacterium]
MAASNSAGQSVAALAATFLSLWPGAANSAPVWVSLDGQPAGTAASVVFDAVASSDSVSTFDVLVSGFWVDTKLDTLGVSYQALEVPGLGIYDQLGAPDLPTAAVTLAVPTDNQQPALLQSDTTGVHAFPAYNVWPLGYGEIDDDTTRAEIFVKDDSLYATPGLWPATPVASVGSTATLVGSVAVTTIRVTPFSVDPTTQILTVAEQLRVSIGHAGNPLQPQPISVRNYRLADAICANWSEFGPAYGPKTDSFVGDFLFVFPGAYYEELQPIITQKKARGYNVTIVTTEEVLGGTCADFRGVIANWYGFSPVQTERYCLLVGDVADIPHCVSPAVVGYAGGVATDDLYATVGGNDLSEEIYLGRLSVDSEQDVIDQVTRILRYEDSPPNFPDYGEALLVAHKENAPGKYEGAHESVRLATYSEPPTFLTAYGSAGATNADVSNVIDGKVGLVAYRGHGSTTAWTGWNSMSQFYSVTNVGALTNTLVNPVVWSFACSQSNCNANESMAEVWMNGVTTGAISHYGATRPSYTSANHELDRRMFKAVYDLDLTKQSHAIEYAEASMTSLHSSAGRANSWMYTLLGDPDMDIRRERPQYQVITNPGVIDVTAATLGIRVQNPNGTPFWGALVGAYKGAPGGGDEVLVNRYTGVDGWAYLPLDSLTAGTLYYTVQETGFSHFDSLTVGTFTGAPAMGEAGVPLSVGPNPMVGSGDVRFSTSRGGAVTVEAFDVRGRRVAVLVDGELPPGDHALRWDGKNEAGRRLANGMYFLRLSTPDRQETVKVALLR